MGAVGSRGATMHRNHLQACTILKKGTRENDGETSHHQVKLQPFIYFHLEFYILCISMYIYITCVCVSHETTHFISFYQPRFGQPVAKGLRIWLCFNARWETHGMAKCVEFNRGKYRQTMIRYDRLLLGLFGCQIWDHTFFGPSTSSSYKTQLAAFSPLEHLNVL